VTARKLIIFFLPLKHSDEHVVDFCIDDAGGPAGGDGTAAARATTPASSSAEPLGFWTRGTPLSPRRPLDGRRGTMAARGNGGNLVSRDTILGCRAAGAC
jgi:hypothetical protein